MPQERHNPFPFPIASEVEAAPGTREEKAARNIIVRRITGIPRRGYLLGDCDSAPVLKGIVDLTTACYALLDALSDIRDMNDIPQIEQEDALREMLEHHGCPETRDMPDEGRETLQDTQ